MKEYEIKLNDFYRMLIGEVPVHFYVESLFRLGIIYLILMVSMRLMGKRMSTQLSRNEMAAVVSLAAAIGVPLMNPDRGLLLSVVIAMVIIGFQFVISKIAAANEKFESVTQDKYNMLVKDGILNTSAMLKTRISRDRVFAQLRSEGISHLGMIKRLYFEAAGSFSILKEPEEIAGLSILPNWDKSLSADLHESAGNEICGHCGAPREAVVTGRDPSCSNCGRMQWTMAVKCRE